MPIAAAAIAALDDADVRRPVRTRRVTRPAAPKADTGPREVIAVITPSDFDHRTDRMGRPYAWVRAEVVKRTVRRTRTIMVQGEAYLLMRDLLGIGASLKIRAIQERIVDRETGEPGAEILRAKQVLKVFDAEGREIDGETGRILAGHERTGHYRRQHHGPANSLVKIVWIDEVKVNGGSAA